MNISELELMYRHREYDKMRDWLNREQYELTAASTTPSISLTLLCAAILLRENQVLNIVIDNDYLQSRQEEKAPRDTSVWHLVALSGNYQALISAISEGRFNPDTLKDSIGTTVWHYLAYSGNYDALIHAIDNNRFNPRTLKGDTGETVWHSLAYSGHYTVLTNAIKYGKFNPVTLKDNNGRTVWHFLAFSGNYFAVMNAIKESRFNPDTLKDDLGRTVWYCLINSGNYAALVKVILDGTFNPDTLQENAGQRIFDDFGEEYADEWKKLYEINIDDVQIDWQEVNHPELYFAFFNMRLIRPRDGENHTSREHYKQCIINLINFTSTQATECPCFNGAMIEAVKSSDLIKFLVMDMADNVELIHNFICALRKYSPGETALIEEFLQTLKAAETNDNNRNSSHYKNHFIWLWYYKERGRNDSFGHIWAKEIKCLDANARTIQNAYRNYKQQSPEVWQQIPNQPQQAANAPQSTTKDTSFIHCTGGNYNCSVS